MGAATLWGVSGVVAKALFNRRIEPWTLVEIRLTASFLTLLVILTLRGHPLRVPRDLLGRLVLLGLAMTSAQFTYYLTVSLAGVSTARFLQYTSPAFVVVVATSLPFGLFLYGLRHITSRLASLAATLEPVVGSAAAMLMLHEVRGVIQITGGLAIVAAVVLIQVSDLFAARREALLPPAPD